MFVEICLQLQNAELSSLIDDVRVHRSPPNDVITSASQRHRPQRRGGRGPRGVSNKVMAKVTSSVRPFVCDLCSVGFMNRATLVRHARVHTGHRPYRCPVCGLAFTQSGNLTRHVRAKHQPPVVNGNACKHWSSSAAAAASVATGNGQAS